jgi:endonuclease-3
VKTATETRHILDKLETQHPNADTELHHRNAFELLVATILSAQSTDQRVNMVTPELFKKWTRQWSDLVSFEIIPLEAAPGRAQS